MKNAALSVTAMLLFAIVVRSQEAKEDRPLNLMDLNNRPVTGRLGLPLGTATEIQAEIFAGRETRRKADQSLYLLKVTHVAGEKLSGTPLLRFSVPRFARVKLANDDFGLYELKNGKRTGRLDSEQVAKLERGYVGKSVRLVVYEVGGFSGMPKDLPKDAPIWQDHRFYFSTHLVVLMERK